MGNGLPSRRGFDLHNLLRTLASTTQNGRPLSNVDRLVAVRRLVECGNLPSLEFLLPLSLQLQGKPYYLTDHFPFSPMFRTELPKASVYMTGRQCGKSQQLAANSVLLSCCIPFFRTLHVTPLYEQIRRFSNNYVRPLIDTSPLRSMWTSTMTESSVLQRSFNNGSKTFFSFAGLDADRIRGLSADLNALDETQDMEGDLMPIIHETMSHSDWAITRYTGTPKTLDNSLTGLWNKSSQAEWFTPCRSCGSWNIPSLEFHLDAMIGPLRDDISEQYPGTICYKCRRPISPREGRWVHRYPEKRWKFAGYHIPQIIMPLHYSRYDKWNELLMKREGWGNMSLNMFYNEVLGVPVDVGQKLVTETDLRKAASLPWQNDPRNPSSRIRERLKHYRMRVLAVDWGGGGEEGVSFTVLSLLGMRTDGKIDVLWGKRLLSGGDHMREAQECMHWLKVFRCDLFAHDYTGAGVVRETVLVQAGFDLNRVIPIQYVRSASKNLMTFVPATPLHNRAHYTMDKTRSLLYTCQAIKLGLLSFFLFDKQDNDNMGLISDFLALIEEKTETAMAGDIYRITRAQGLTDDFAQAVNIGCVTLWHATDTIPNFAHAAKVARLTPSLIQAAGNRDWGWSEDRTMSGFMGQP